MRRTRIVHAEILRAKHHKRNVVGDLLPTTFRISAQMFR